MMVSGILNQDMPKVTVTTFIEEALKVELKELADSERRSVSQMVALLVERAVDDAKKRGVISGQDKTHQQDK